MLYVLDLDDTLYLEKDYVCSGFSSVSEWLTDNLGLCGFFDRAWDLFEQGIRKNIFDKVLNELNAFDLDLVRFLVQFYRSHHPNIRLQEDAVRFLELQGPERLALITDGYACSQNAKIKALNLKKYINKIVITDEWGIDYWKPNQRSFLAVQAGRTPKECVYIGDNPKKDFIAPQELGWARSIRINRYDSLHSLDKTPEHCVEIQSFAEIIG